MKYKYVKFIIVFLYVVAMSAVVWYFNGSLLGIDDANIYMVYMRNFSNGYGFVFNAGLEKVDGFTSFLWTVVGACFYQITDKPELFFLATNILLVTYSLWRLVSFTDFLFNESRLISPASFILLDMLAVIPGYFEWTLLSYLETGLWSSLLILITLNILENTDEKVGSKSMLRFYLLLTLIILCRPESILWCICFIVLKCLKTYLHVRILKRIAPQLIVCLLVFCSVTGLFMLWRLSYFGYPFPNTYYVKVSADKLKNIKEGIIYCKDYILHNPLALILLGAGFWKFFKDLNPASSTLSSFQITYVITLVSFFIPLYTGGDHFHYFRFIQPTVPIMWLCFILWIRDYRLFSSRLIYVYSFFIVLIMALIPKDNLASMLKNGRSAMAIEWDIAKEGRKNCSELNMFFDHQTHLPTQGVLPAGGTAYAYKGVTFDLLGLNDVDMAHSEKSKDTRLPKNHASFNKKVFYKKHPDLFWLSGGFVSTDSLARMHGLNIIPFSALVFQHIYADSLFKMRYSKVVISKKGEDDHLIIFVSNDFLKAMNKDYYSYQSIK